AGARARGAAAGLGDHERRRDGRGVREPARPRRPPDRAERMTLRAEILAVGSELLPPPRVETNGAYITGRLLEIGIEVGARVTVADDAALLESAFRTALARADVIIATGGLGPTEDDLTREAAAAALGRGMRRDPAILEGLRARFARFNRPMAPVNEKQAD